MDVYSVDIAVESSFPTPYANLTLLPILLASLAMQKHTPDTKKTFSPEYDFIIVGGGTAGAVVANRLTELPDVKVLLLECGGSPSLQTEVPVLSRDFWNTDLNWGHVTVSQKMTALSLMENKVPLQHGKAIGGTMLLNDMLHVRGNRKNYDDWAAGGATGWSYEEVLPYFKKFEKNFNIAHDDFEFHTVRGEMSVDTPKYNSELHEPLKEAVKMLDYKFCDPNGKNQTGFYEYETTISSGQRCSSAKAYLVPAERRANLDILKNAFVRKILIKDGIAYGVQFDFDGKTREVVAKKEVIVSAGAIHTAQLLKLSGIGPREELESLGIPVVADLPVGFNLQTHYGTNLVFLLDNSIEEAYEKIKNPKHVQNYIHNREGPLVAPFLTIYLAFLDGLNPRPDVDDPRHELSIEEFSTEVAKRHFGLKPEVYKHVFEPHEGKPMYTCNAYTLQPKSSGVVMLNSIDPYDSPLIDPNFLSNSEDFQDIIDGLKVCKVLGHSEPMKIVGSRSLGTHYPGCEAYVADDDKYFECQLKSMVFTSHHPVGTTKMGNPDDPSTVVDPELKVKGVKHLRIVDGSIMPRITSGSTNIPIMMIAEKASDIIKKPFLGESVPKNPTTTITGGILYKNGESFDEGSSLEGSSLVESSSEESGFDQPAIEEYGGPEGNDGSEEYDMFEEYNESEEYGGFQEYEPEERDDEAEKYDDELEEYDDEYEEYDDELEEYGGEPEEYDDEPEAYDEYGESATEETQFQQPSPEGLVRVGNF